MVATPLPTRHAGQRSQDIDPFLVRYIPPWITPPWALAEQWRTLVRNQPIAMVCRDTLISNINALDWKIEPRESDQRDELKDEIRRVTRGLEFEWGMDFADHVEWIGQDLLDLPFGGAAEVIRAGDAPEGDVLTLIPLDAGTLFPTLNVDYPVGQRVEGYALDPVFFPNYAINRVYINPRTEIRREGWGMAPPEKIFLALEMLRRGDVYYANLLLDTPEAGILDLGDMERESAQQWVESFRSLLTGIDPFKIPVLYEHDNEVKFIPFIRPPSEIIYDSVTMKFASIVAGGYGMSLSDIGIQAIASGGETLAGSIRQERRTRRTGLAVLKKKYAAYFNRLMPDTLKFSWIDYDDELNVAKGRARVATVTAFSQATDKGILTPKEGRLQMIADGLVTISIPEEIPEDEFDILDVVSEKTNPFGNTPERPGLLPKTEPVSSGGQGESSAMIGKADYTNAFSDSIKRSLSSLYWRMDGDKIRRLIDLIAPTAYERIKSVIEHLNSEAEFDAYIQNAEQLVGDEAEEEFENSDWWLTELDERELIAVLSVIYLSILQQEAEDMAMDLFLKGLIPSPHVGDMFRLTNNRALEQLRSRIRELEDLINDGTKYYISRMILGAIMRVLSSPDNVAKINEGLDINTILRDNGVVQQIIQDVNGKLRNLIDFRTQSIASYEVGLVENAARIDQYRAVGLTKKYWLHVGNDVPCREYCEPNIVDGVVKLDYQYRSAFGPVLGPLGHPHCHCHLEYVKEELYSVVTRNGFEYWTGV